MKFNNDPQQYKEIKMWFRKTIKPIIKSSCGGSGNSNFLQKTTIRDLLEQQTHYRRANDNEKFQLYVGVLDKITQNIKNQFPFIDLTGIDFSWTIEQIIDVIVQAYLSLPCLTLKDLGVNQNESSC